MLGTIMNYSRLSQGSLGDVATRQVVDLKTAYPGQQTCARTPRSARPGLAEPCLATGEAAPTVGGAAENQQGGSDAHRTNRLQKHNQNVIPTPDMLTPGSPMDPPNKRVEDDTRAEEEVQDLNGSSQSNVRPVYQSDKTVAKRGKEPQGNVPPAHEQGLDSQGYGLRVRGAHPGS